MNREVMIVTGAGQISMAIARRIGYGKKIRCNCGNSKPYLKKVLLHSKHYRSFTGRPQKNMINAEKKWPRGDINFNYDNGPMAATMGPFDERNFISARLTTVCINHNIDWLKRGLSA